jgi:hypothetical protein
MKISETGPYHEIQAITCSFFEKPGRKTEKFAHPFRLRALVKIEKKKTILRTPLCLIILALAMSLQAVEMP